MRQKPRAHKLTSVSVLSEPYLYSSKPELYTICDYDFLDNTISANNRVNYSPTRHIWRNFVIRLERRADSLANSTNNWTDCSTKYYVLSRVNGDHFFRLGFPVKIVCQTLAYISLFGFSLCGRRILWQFQRGRQHCIWQLWTLWKHGGAYINMFEEQHSNTNSTRSAPLRTWHFLDFHYIIKMSLTWCKRNIHILTTMLAFSSQVDHS